MVKRMVVPGRNEHPETRIDWFDDFGTDNKYRFLSNFYVGTPLYLNGVPFLTGEHLFAAYKASKKSDFEMIRKTMTPAAAKSAGRRISLRPDWELIKYDVMRMTLKIKFDERRPEAAMLLDTGDAFLVEGTDWNDQVWGISRETGLGRNWLGVLLMARRAELRTRGSYDSTGSVRTYWRKLNRNG